MIARTWIGKTRSEIADEYQKFLMERAIPDYRKQEGLLNIIFLRNDKNEFTVFEIITIWKSEESLKGFYSNNLLEAKYYEEDKTFLIDFPKYVKHSEVFAYQTIDYLESE